MKALLKARSTMIHIVTAALLLQIQLSTSSPSKKNNILVVGSLNSDSYIPLERFPEVGENIVVTNKKIEQNIAGGKGCNQAIAISRLTSVPSSSKLKRRQPRHTNVSFIGRFGNDAQGKLLYNALKQERNKIDLKLCKFCSDFSSGQGIIFQNVESGEVSAIVIGGSNLHGWDELRGEEEHTFESSLSKYLKHKSISTILLQREIPDWVNERIVSIANRECIIIQDLGGQDLPLKKEYISQCDYLIPNETELKRLLLSFIPDYVVETNSANEDDELESIIEAAKVLQQYTKVKNIIVTLGSKGCIYLTTDNNDVHHNCMAIPPCTIPASLKVIDETGAGDAFRAAFALALTENMSKLQPENNEEEIIRQALVFASAAGALAVTKQGAVPSLPTRKDVEWLLSQQLQQSSSLANTDHEQVLEEEQPQPEQDILQSSLAGTATRGGGGDATNNKNNDNFPFLIGSRLNSMKDRLDLWKDKPNTVQGYIERQSTIRGLTCIDFNYPQHFTDLTPKQAKVQLDKYNLKAGAVCLRYPHELYQQGSFTHYNETIRNQSIQLTKQAADAARVLNCSEVVIWSAYDGYDYSFQVNYETKFQQIVTAFQQICDAYPDIRFSLEYKPTDENTRFFVIPSTGTALYLVDQINRRNMGLTLDFGHCLMAGENPAQSVSLVASRHKLFGIQLNDGYSRLAAEDGLIFGSVHPYVALEVMYYLLINDYDGHIYFDTFPQRSDPVQEAEKNIQNVNMFWKAALRLRDVLDIEKDMMVHDAISVLNKMDDALDWARNN